MQAKIRKTVPALSPAEALAKAIEIAGGMRALGRAIGTSHQNIRGWKTAPPTRVLAIERATGISRHVLRPDIYPVERATP